MLSHPQACVIFHRLSGSRFSVGQATMAVMVTSLRVFYAKAVAG